MGWDLVQEVGWVMRSSDFVSFCIFVAWCDSGLYSINSWSRLIQSRYGLPQTKMPRRDLEPVTHTFSLL